MIVRAGTTKSTSSQEIVSADSLRRWEAGGIAMLSPAAGPAAATLIRRWSEPCRRAPTAVTVNLNHGNNQPFGWLTLFRDWLINGWLKRN